jgi:predicted nucleotidyltransferase
MNYRRVEQEATIRQFAKIARERFGKEIRKIILFGSAARGDAREDSDIDILVVAKNEDYQLQKALSGIAFDLMLETKELLSVKVFSRQEFEFLREVNSSFLSNVLKEGIEIE